MKNLSILCVLFFLSVQHLKAEVFVKVKVGEVHTCALTSSQEMYCWGSNEHRQITLSNASNLFLTPVKVAEGVDDITDIQVSKHGSCAYGRRVGMAAIRTKTWFCWGEAFSWDWSTSALAVGELDLATSPHYEGYCTTYVYRGSDYLPPPELIKTNCKKGSSSFSGNYNPYPVGFPTNTDVLAFNNAKSITVGSGYACGIDAEGLKCWGNNHYSAASGDTDFSDTLGFNNPNRVELLQVKRVIAGKDSTCAYVDQSGFYCWGAAFSVGGIPLLNRSLGFWTKYSDISLGDNYACAQTESNTLECWGRNESGQMGIGSYSNSESPIALGLTNVTSFATAKKHTCAIAESKLYCWGSNSHGQLGTGNQITSNSPVLVSF